MAQKSPPRFFLILILGFLTALSPFSIDMYLPAFPQIADDFKTTVAQVSLSLSSYFIGLSLGQLFYGPLLDRFGRKKPLYYGLIIYILTSIACLRSHSIETLILLRFIQAVGGCAAGVGSMAMVRDLFTTKESAQVYSLLILILGASPLLAPTVGGYLVVAFGWHSIFTILAGIALLLLLVVTFFLPESSPADQSVSLKLKPIMKTFGSIFVHPQFYTYVISGAVAFSGLFAYLAGSTIIFMTGFGLTPQVYGWIFATISIGLIGASQINVLLLKKFSNEQILYFGMLLQTLTSLVFFVGTLLGIWGLASTVILFFILLSCLGLTNPNSTALALAPFGKTAGSAAALMGFLQMGLGALVSMLVGLLEVQTSLPVIAIICATSVLAFGILLWGRTKIRHLAHADPSEAVSIVPH